MSTAYRCRLVLGEPVPEAHCQAVRLQGHGTLANELDGTIRLLDVAQKPDSPPFWALRLAAVLTEGALFTCRDLLLEANRLDPFSL